MHDGVGNASFVLKNIKYKIYIGGNASCVLKSIYFNASIVSLL